MLFKLAGVQAAAVHESKPRATLRRKNGPAAILNGAAPRARPHGEARMSDTRQLADVCFERVLDWLLTHANVNVVGDPGQFLKGIHAIVAVTVHEVAERQRARVIRAEPSAN